MIEHDFILILKLAAAQGLHDFAWWFGVAKENRQWEYARVYRIYKETIDLGVTSIILIFVLHIHWLVITAFFVAKWLHGCDSFYNGLRYVFTNQPTTDKADWRWWTPLGLFRSKISFTPLHFEPGIVTIREAWQMTAVGFVLALILLCVKAYIAN